jgi:hypothetical protein
MFALLRKAFLRPRGILKNSIIIKNTKVEIMYAAIIFLVIQNVIENIVCNVMAL